MGFWDDMGLRERMERWAMGGFVYSHSYSDLLLVERSQVERTGKSSQRFA